MDFKTKWNISSIAIAIENLILNYGKREEGQSVISAIFDAFIKTYPNRLKVQWNIGRKASLNSLLLDILFVKVSKGVKDRKKEKRRNKN